jgi:hypothetical protein
MVVSLTAAHAAASLGWHRAGLQSLHATNPPSQSMADHKTSSLGSHVMAVIHLSWRYEQVSVPNFGMM